MKEKNIVAMLEAEVRANGGDAKKGRVAFVNRMKREVLGITENDAGNPVIAKGSARPEEFSLREVAEAVGGRQWVNNFVRPGEGPDLQTVLEAGPGIDPTNFLHTSTYNSLVGGLIEAKVIEAFNNPAYIGDQLVETVPTRQNGEKMIGVTSIAANDGEIRKPGEPHARTGFGEHYVTTPELVEKALAVEVTQEAAFYDYTGQVLQRAAAVGDVLAYGKEKTIIDLALGVTNPYIYNGTGYNTYQTSTPWINSHQNVMEDYTDIDNMLALFEQMTDPTTGREILVNPTQILHMPRARNTFNRVLNSTEVRETTNTNSVTISPNPVKQNFQLLESPIVFNRAKAADGLNLSADNAKKLWIAGEFKKALKWMEAWALRVRQAQATEYVMLDRGLIAAYFANHRGIGAVVEPRYLVKNTH